MAELGLRVCVVRLGPLPYFASIVRLLLGESCNFKLFFKIKEGQALHTDLFNISDDHTVYISKRNIRIKDVL